MNSNKLDIEIMQQLAAQITKRLFRCIGADRGGYREVARG